MSDKMWHFALGAFLLGFGVFEAYIPGVWRFVPVLLGMSAGMNIAAGIWAATPEKDQK